MNPLTILQLVSTAVGLITSIPKSPPSNTVTPSALSPEVVTGAASFLKAVSGSSSVSPDSFTALLNEFLPVLTSLAHLDQGKLLSLLQAAEAAFQELNTMFVKLQALEAQVKSITSSGVTPPLQGND